MVRHHLPTLLLYLLGWNSPLPGVDIMVMVFQAGILLPWRNPPLQRIFHLLLLLKKAANDMHMTMKKSMLLLKLERSNLPEIQTSPSVHKTHTWCFVNKKKSVSKKRLLKLFKHRQAKFQRLLTLLRSWQRSGATLTRRDVSTTLRFMRTTRSATCVKWLL